MSEAGVFVRHLLCYRHERTGEGRAWGHLEGQPQSWDSKYTGPSSAQGSTLSREASLAAKGTLAKHYNLTDAKAWPLCTPIWASWPPVRPEGLHPSLETLLSWPPQPILCPCQAYSALRPRLRGSGTLSLAAHHVSFSLQHRPEL